MYSCPEKKVHEQLQQQAKEHLKQTLNELKNGVVEAESNSSEQSASRQHRQTSPRILSAVCLSMSFNPITGTLKPLSNGPLYSNTVIGALAVDGWAVTFGTARMALPIPLLAVPNVTAHPSMASVPASYYSIWHYNYLCPLKG